MSTEGQIVHLTRLLRVRDKEIESLRLVRNRQQKEIEILRQDTKHLLSVFNPAYDRNCEEERVMDSAKHVAWLESLAKKGGKGRVDGVDARALGRIAKEIKSLREENKELLKALASFSTEAELKKERDELKHRAEIMWDAMSYREPMIRLMQVEPDVADWFKEE